ncbi:hypothetical protein [Stutzerimonas stutzeri]|uniref:hypothetical protein n=1 Tax=Stutzerimonas stutzeri TaxID=316 RepID=UPI0011AF0D08|nr:hypothetical protein [Stutzerimonas stutzeri]MCQ4263775.1 hypothetical protein [Stutzerimonas stutzeri]
MPMTFIGGLANPAVPVAARNASRRKRTVEYDSDLAVSATCGRSRAFQGARMKFSWMKTKNGMPDGMPK